MASFSIPAEDRAARRVGTILAGKYGVERVLGVGGMASVYMAVHRNGRRVALKLLHEELCVHRDVRARFVREGYVANAVGHPGAVLVFDDDVTEEGAPFLVMEMLEGETLSDRASRRGGRLPCREVLALAHQLLDVLAAAHARGIVHRDIKPENLFLTTDGRVKVLDFGVARMRDDAGGTHATATGARIGTPAFMAPEQALGRTAEIDARTDLWAAGATMFTLLAGRTVHRAESAAELIVVTATTPPIPLSEVDPEAPPAVAAVVDRALAFKRDARWEDARSMQRALEEAHREAFGEALSPSDVGPAPLPAIIVPRLQEERETLPIERSDAAAQRPKSGRSSGGDAGVASAPTQPSDRSPRTDEARGSAAQEHATVRLGPAERAPRSSPSATPAPSSHEPSATPSSHEPSATPSSHEPSATPAPEPPSSHEPSATPAPPASDGRSALPEPTPSPSAATSSSAAPVKTEPAPRNARALTIVMISLAAAAGVLALRWGARGTDSATQPGASSSAAPAPRECAVNADCKGRERPSICRKDDGACVALTTDQCKVLASDGDVENDATVWIGAMYPVSYLTEGWIDSERAVDLARRDFAQTTGGLPPARPGGPKRPIGVVFCDDREAPERAAEHLVRDVRVPAILGFGRSKEVMDLASSLFLPNDVLALAANTSSALRDIPASPDGARLVWRVTTSTDMIVPAFASVLSEVIEPAVRADPSALTAGEPVRVAFVRVANPTGQSYADGFLGALRFNGKSVADNGKDFLQVESPDRMVDAPDDDAEIVGRLTAFRPHVVLPIGGSRDLIQNIEAAWPAGARSRPRYLNASYDVDAPFVEWMRKNPDVRRRYYCIDAAGPAEAASRFVMRYNEVFTPHVTPQSATPAPYDAFYLFAYAAASLGDRPLTGPALASAIPRLLPGEGRERISVGPGDIYRAFYALGAGKSLDLEGAQTTLDFDVRTGDATVDFAVYCMTPGGPSEAPRQVESGLFFRARTKKLEGAYHCP